MAFIRLTIPNYIGLDLSHNKLKSLPEEFSNLHKLVTIDLANNDFTAIPEVLRRIPALTTVDLSSNKIEEVHREDYESLQCLETLILRENPLREDTKMVLQSIVRVDIIT